MIFGKGTPVERAVSGGRTQRAGAGEPIPGEDPRKPPSDDFADRVAGERGVPSVNRARSMQSRVSSVLAVGLMSALGFGLLSWYYVSALTRASRVHQRAQSASRSRAQGEMPLPSLGHIEPPALRAAPKAVGESTAQARPVAEQLLGPPPPMPSEASSLNSLPGFAASRQAAAPGMSGGVRPKTHTQRVFERELSGPVFAKESDASTHAITGDLPRPVSGAATPAEAVPGSGGGTMPRLGEGRDLATLLQPSVTEAARAQVLPTRRFLLSKGAFIDCTLETAIDSTLPGMTTCITATDTFSADGTVVLLERGTKLIGETRGEVAQGASRVFVLWTEARTPTGVVVPLASPGTDELGRSGLSGVVTRHFWDRFGAAILISVINGAVQAGAESTSHGAGTVILNPSASQDVMTEVLKSTVAIAPTLRKNQGDRISVLVARDLDFRSVYELRTTTAVVSGVVPR